LNLEGSTNTPSSNSNTPDVSRPSSPPPGEVDPAVAE
jgi:hypothetical protein